MHSAVQCCNPYWVSFSYILLSVWYGVIPLAVSDIYRWWWLVSTLICSMGEKLASCLKLIPNLWFLVWCAAICTLKEALLDSIHTDKSICQLIWTFFSSNRYHFQGVPPSPLYNLLENGNKLSRLLQCQNARNEKSSVIQSAHIEGFINHSIWPFAALLLS